MHVDASMRCSVLSDIKSAVILYIFLWICSVTDISAEVPPIGVNVCVMTDLSSRQKVFSFVARGH